MRRRTLTVVVTLALGACVALPVTSGGQKPGKKPATTPGMRIDQPRAIVFGSATTITGRLTGKNQGGRTVTLEGDAYPYATFQTRATTVTDNQGRFRFTVSPRVNTRYRVRGPSVLSAVVTLKVRFRVTLSLSDSTPSRGALIRFSGSVRPPRDGRTARIQKLSSRGTFFTLVRTRLRDAGTIRSRYSRRVRIRRSGIYRVKIIGDAANATGYSRSVTITVH